jgi:hemerythrin-like domain-containing protein
MNQLITQLREEHVEITRLLDAMAEICEKDNETEGKAFIEDMVELKKVLVAHLDLEDKLVYPKLISSQDSEIKKLGKNFSNEMLGITKVALKYFEDYSEKECKKLKNDPKFKKDTQLINKAVRKRVELEESILYPAFEKENKK